MTAPRGPKGHGPSAPAPSAAAPGQPAPGSKMWPAPAKLNLFLHILGRRPDGYHELQTCFQFVDLCDDITIRVRADGAIRRVVEMAGVRMLPPILLAGLVAFFLTRQVDMIHTQRDREGAFKAGASD